jgi:ArsR family transcriptional regulator
MTRQAPQSAERVAEYADMFSAMGTEPRLRIRRLLLSARPEGLVAGDTPAKLEIPNSTLSHYFDKFKTEDLVQVQRDRPPRYNADSNLRQEVLRFLNAECCTRTTALKPAEIIHIGE